MLGIQRSNQNESLCHMTSGCLPSSSSSHRGSTGGTCTGEKIKINDFIILCYHCMLPFWKGEYNKYSSCVVERVAWKEGNWNTHVIFKNHWFCFLEIWNIKCNDGKKTRVTSHIISSMEYICISHSYSISLTSLWN